jgi:hypothetical protein
MSIDLIKIINNSPYAYTHAVNYYIVVNQSIYGDFLRSVETTYYAERRITQDFIDSIRPDAELVVYWEISNKQLNTQDSEYMRTPSKQSSLGLLEWYANKEDITSVMGELMNIFEFIVSRYRPDHFIKEVPALVYDEEQQDWIISKTETEPVFLTNVLSVREDHIDYDDLKYMTGSQMIDIPFRIVQALHYFNNLVRAEKVPDWVYKIINDYEAYRLLDA